MDANIGYVFSNKEGGKKWNWQSEVDFPRGKSWFDHRLAKPVEIDDQIVAELLPINSHFILDYNYWLNTLIPSICSQYFAQILRAYNSSAPSLNRLEQTHFHDRKYILTPCYKQFLPGLEEPEKSADAEQKSQKFCADFKYVNLKIELLQIFEKKS